MATPSSARQLPSTGGVRRLPLIVLLAVLVQCIVGSATTAHAQMTTDSDVIDVAVFYTARAREDAGGTAMIKADIDLMVSETNQAYMDGDVNLRLKLAAVAEAGDYAVTLVQLSRASDGFVDGVHRVRDQVAADIVVLVIEGYVGIAYRPWSLAAFTDDLAFAIVSRANGGSGFAHEVGHMMGLLHDRYENYEVRAAPFAPLFEWGFGYVNRRTFDSGVGSSARWRTIMAYRDECDARGSVCRKLLRFSNPNQIYPDPDGDPLGMSGEEATTDVDGPADAVRTQNQTGPLVASYRSAPAITAFFDAETYTTTEGRACNRNVALKR